MVLCVFVKEHREQERERERAYVCFRVHIVCLIGVRGRCYSFS